MSKLNEDARQTIEDLASMMAIVHKKVESLFLNFVAPLSEDARKNALPEEIRAMLQDINNDFLVAVFGTETVLSRLDSMCRRYSLEDTSDSPPADSQGTEGSDEEVEDVPSKASLH